MQPYTVRDKSKWTGNGGRYRCNLSVQFDPKRFQIEYGSGYFCYQFEDGLGSSLGKREDKNKKSRY